MKLSKILCVFLPLLTAACHSNKWYVDAAVQEAREFLLESEYPVLTVMQQEFVRFAAPSVLTTPVLGGIPYGVHQSCITWVVPDYPYAIMVCGYGDDNFSDWTPNRILLRDLTIPNTALDNATATARAHILRDLFDTLSTSNYNRVRFSRPEVYRTAFDIQAENPDSKNITANNMQYSLVWKFDPDEKGNVFCAAACGTAEENMQNWRFSFCTFMSAEEFERELLVQENFPAAVNPVEE